MTTPAGLFKAELINFDAQRQRCCAPITIAIEPLHLVVDDGTVTYRLPLLALRVGGLQGRPHAACRVVITFSPDIKKDYALFLKKGRLLDYAPPAGLAIAMQIVVNDVAAIEELRRVINALRGQRIALFLKRNRLLLGALALQIISFTLLYTHLDVIVDVCISDKTAQRLGERVVRHPMIAAQTCMDRTHSPVLALLEDKLATTSFKVKPSIRIAPNKDVNAFALPGGIIYLHSSLVLKAETADEMIGVIAHEYGHSVHRHSLAALVRFMITSAFTEILVGSHPSFTMMQLLQMLHYSRDMERQADATALEVLRQLGVSPKGFKTFFERIKKMGAANENSSMFKKLKQHLPGILRTHPYLEDRMQMIDQASDNTSTTTIIGEKEYALLQKQVAKRCPVDSKKSKPESKPKG